MLIKYNNNLIKKTYRETRSLNCIINYHFTKSIIIEYQPHFDVAINFDNKYIIFNSDFNIYIKKGKEETSIDNSRYKKIFNIVKNISCQYFKHFNMTLC